MPPACLPVAVLAAALLSAPLRNLAADVPVAPTARPTDLSPAAGAGTTPSAERVAAIRTELEAMLETDQAQRQQMAETGKKHGDSSPEMAALWAKQHASDAHNIARLEAIVAEIGWPKISIVGKKAAGAAFLILQHADLEYQAKYLPLCREAAAADDMRRSSLALLEDRVRLRQGKKQIYGSQVRRNEAGLWETEPLEDAAHVDERRASVGLGPLATYLQGFADRGGGAVYDPRKDKPAADAPPLKTTLFSPDDDARAALEKLRAVPPRGGPPAIDFQRACQEFLVRFPESGSYAAVRILAAQYAGFLKDEDLKQLDGWDPMAGENDPKLGGEQQAAIAVSRIHAESARSTVEGADAPDRELDALLAQMPRFGQTAELRNAVGMAAVYATPEKGLPALRAVYGDSAVEKEYAAVLERVGKPYELTFTGIDGRPVDLKDYVGKVVIVAFWFGGSRPNGGAPSSFAELKTLERDYGTRGLAIIAVSMNSNREDVLRVLKDNAVNWPTYWSPAGWNNEIAEREKIKIAPSFLLVDRTGTLRLRGAFIGGAMARVKKLLSE